jgi:WD40 repeat protein
VLVIQANGEVQWCEAASGKIIAASSNGPPLRSLAPSPDSRHVALLGTDACVRIVSGADGRMISGPFTMEGGAQSMMWTPDGTAVAVASGRPGGLDSRDQSLRLWDAVSGRDLGLEFRHRDDIRSMAFSEDGRWIGTGSEDYEARIWDRRTGREAGQAMRHNGWVVAMAFSPDGKILATGSSDGFLRLWRVPDGEPIGPAMDTAAEPRFVGTVCCSRCRAPNWWHCGTRVPPMNADWREPVRVMSVNALSEAPVICFSIFLK